MRQGEWERSIWLFTKRETEAGNWMIPVSAEAKDPFSLPHRNPSGSVLWMLPYPEAESVGLLDSAFPWFTDNFGDPSPAQWAPGMAEH